MSRLVFDASAAFEYPARTPTGLSIDSLIQGSLPIITELMDVEVISITRRNLRLKRLTLERATLLINSLQAWPIERVGAQQLCSLIWSLRNNLGLTQK